MIITKVFFVVLYGALLFAIIKTDLNKINPWIKFILLVLGLPLMILILIGLLYIYKNIKEVNVIFVFGCGIYCVFAMLLAISNLFAKQKADAFTKSKSMAKSLLQVLKIFLCLSLFILFLWVIFFL